jgi:hypothetical protein
MNQFFSKHNIWLNEQFDEISAMNQTDIYEMVNNRFQLIRIVHSAFVFHWVLMSICYVRSFNRCRIFTEPSCITIMEWWEFRMKKKKEKNRMSRTSAWCQRINCRYNTQQNHGRLSYVYLLYSHYEVSRQQIRRADEWYAHSIELTTTRRDVDKNNEQFSRRRFRCRPFDMNQFVVL